MGKKSTALSSAVCTNCGGQMDVNGVEETVECPYCGTKYSTSELLNESDAVRTERIKAQTAKDLESARMKNAAEKEQREEAKAAVEKFKKSKFSKVLIIFAVISVIFCAVSFSDGRILSGLCAVIMAGLFITSWLMGMHIVKEKKKGIRIIAAIVAFVLIVPYFNLYNAGGPSYKTKPEDIDWAILELGDYLPEPEKPYGEVGVDLAHALSVTLHDVEKEQFKAYRDACIAMGYTVESEETGTTYVAFNNEGYQVRLVHSSEELYVHLDAPEEMGEFEWPTNGLGSLLPATKSNIGDVSWDNSETFIVQVGNTTLAEYKEYVKACEAEGFTVDYSKDDEYYSALNADGYELTLRYLGFNKIEVSLKAPEGGAPAPTGGENDAPATDAIVIVAGEAGEYGEKFTVNKGTEFEDTYYVYRLPAGTYKATNVGDYTTQLNVYSDELKKVDGWEEPAETFFVELIDVSKSTTFSIKDGQHIEVAEPTELELEKISDDVPEDTTPTEKPTPSEDTTSSGELVNGMRPEFKEAMDSYEAFFDEYCGFMKKYIASNGSDMSLLLDYASYMSKYAEMMEDFEAWESEEMNNAETAYYIQVQNRINQKLLEVAQ